MHLNTLEQASNAELNVARFAKSYGHIALPDMHEDQRSLGGSFKQVPFAWTQNWCLSYLSWSQVRVRERCTNYIYDSDWGYSDRFFTRMPIQAGLPEVAALKDP